MPANTKSNARNTEKPASAENAAEPASAAPAARANKKAAPATDAAPAPNVRVANVDPAEDELSRDIAEALGAPLPATGDDEDGEEESGDGAPDGQEEDTGRLPVPREEESGEEAGEEESGEEETGEEESGDGAPDKQEEDTGRLPVPLGEDTEEDTGEAETRGDELAQLRRQIAALEERLAQGGSGVTPLSEKRRDAEGDEKRRVAASTSEEEVASAESAGDLQRLQDKFQRLEDFASDNAEGYEGEPATPGGEPVVYTAEQMRALARNARAALRAIPRQAQLLQARAGFNKFAEEAYPDFKDPKSEAARFYEGYRQNPAMRALPYLKLIVGDALAGMKAREARAKAKTANPNASGDGRPGTKAPPPARRNVPALSPGSARRPAAQTGRQAREAAVNKRIAASDGSAAALAEAFEEL